MPNPMRNVEREILDLLLKGPATAKSLASSRGCSTLKYTRKICMQLYLESRIHIIEWKKEKLNGPWVKVFALGDDDDAFYPEARTPKEREKDYRLRQSTLKQLHVTP